MLIVDDEPIISQGLRYTIPWTSLGIEVVGEASDGKQALEYIEEQPVDIILTDVRMPEMDGIELSRVLFEKKPEIHVIIISGYDEFEYAREALRYRVKDYLLKPVDIDELVKIVIELKELILEKISFSCQKQNQKRQEALRQVILQPHTIKMSHDEELFKDFHFCVVTSEIHDFATLNENSTDSEIEVIKERWEMILQSAMNNDYCQSVSYFTQNNVSSTICYSCEPNLDEEIRLLLQKDIKSPIPLTFAVSSTFTRLEDAQESYKVALAALLEKETIEGRVISCRHLKQKNHTRNSSPVSDKFFIFEALFKLDQKGIHQHINDLFVMMKKENYSLLEIRNVCQGMNGAIKGRLGEIYKEDMLEEVTCLINNETDLHYFNTGEWLKKLLVHDFEKWVELIKRKKKGKKSWVIEKAVLYIKEHYHHDLKASEVANEIHVTPNYFSVIFKREMDQSFNEYLNELRIEKAKYLLTDTSDRIFEIAKDVGYKEYKYFVQVFRKKTGMTPTDYRDYKETN
jgi:two-component system, response regulator YesN